MERYFSEMYTKEKGNAEDEEEDEAEEAAAPLPRRRHPAGDGDAGGVGGEDAQILCGRCGLRMMKTTRIATS